mgnify:FL=1
MTDLRNKIIGILSPDLCYRADRKADDIIALVTEEYEEFVFAIATKVSQRDAHIEKLSEAHTTMTNLWAQAVADKEIALGRIAELEAMVENMTAHIRVDPNE